jgi:predicted metal-dependent phosphoesterase TrpH
MDPSTCVERAIEVGLDGIAITDHNTMTAIEQAREVAGQSLAVVPAEEIDTTGGQIIGLFLSEPIDPWQPPRSVIDQIHDQGGVAVAPHPFDEMREGLSEISKYAGSLDAIETLNSRCVRATYNRRAAEFADKHGLPRTGGSDAHFGREIGTALTEVETNGNPSEIEERLVELREALLEGRTNPVGKRGAVLVHAGTKCVKLYNRIRHG